MPGKQFDPEHTVDRTVEQDEFQKLLQFTDNARLLGISDREGTGKTTLLRKLEYNCQRVLNPRLPVSLVHLEDETLTTPFQLIERMNKTLGRDQFKKEFKRFDEYNRQRRLRNISFFGNSGSSYSDAVSANRASTTGSATRVMAHENHSSRPSYSGEVLAEGATIPGSNNTFAGQVFNGPVTFSELPWGNDQEELALEACINAFYEDLRAVGNAPPGVVIMLDSFEQCSSAVQDWIKDDFLWEFVFDVDNRPSRVIVVIAGTELPDNVSMGDASLVRSTSSLASWGEDHVKEFLALHGYGDLSDEDIDVIRDIVSRGKSIAAALKVADAIRQG